jgi:F-type H+-transporting ATPase subunit a
MGLLGIFAVLHNLGGFFGEIPFLAIGIPAVTGAYFDWFGGCIQAFIFCTLTTLFIKQAAGD